MSKQIAFLQNHLKLLRRIVQISALILIFVIPVLNHFEITTIIGTFYSLTIGNLDIADPLIVLQTILLQKEIYLPLLLAGIIPVIIAMIFGKVFCSWVCPFNTIAETVYWLRSKIRKDRQKKTAPAVNAPPYIYWLILATFLTLMLMLALPLVVYFSMPGIISSQAADAIFLGEFGWEIIIVGVILLIEFLIFRRVWCKFICPVGAFLSLFRTRRTMRIHFNKAHCLCHSGESPCIDNCQLALNPKKQGTFPYCHNCGACVDICQRKYGKAITFSFKN